MPRFALPSALLLILAASASAADRPQAPKVTVASVEVQRYDSIVAPRDENAKGPRLYNQVPAPEGFTYLAVLVQLDIQWAEGGANRLALQQKEAVLLDGQTPIQWVGIYREWCQVATASRVALLQRDKNRTFAAIYQVPKEKPSFKLSLAGQQIDVAVPKTAIAMDAGKVITATIKKTTLVASIPAEYGTDPVTNPKGKLLVVTVEYETKRGDVKPPFDAAVFWHQWVGVKLDEQTIPNMGELSDGKLTAHGENASNPMQTGGMAGGTLKDTITFVFPVPADVKNFDLMILGAVMAKGIVGK